MRDPLKGLDWRRWTYNGMPMNKPHIMVWRAFWYMPLALCLALTCLVAGIGFGRDAAQQIWKEVF